MTYPSDYFSKLGRKGGLARSKRKLAACRKNWKAAIAARHGNKTKVRRTKGKQ